MIAVLQARLFKLVVDLVQKELWAINLRSKSVPKSGIVDVLSSFATFNASSSNCGWYYPRILQYIPSLLPTWGRMTRPLQGTVIPATSGLFRSAVHIILEISGGSRLPRSRPFRNHLVDRFKVRPRSSVKIRQPGRQITDPILVAAADGRQLVPRYRGRHWGTGPSSVE